MISAQDAERAIVSACLAEPKAVGEVLLTVNDFADLRWKTVWNAMSGAWSAGESFDAVLIADRIKTQGNQALSASDLSELLVTEPGLPVLLPQYAAVVKRSSVARQVSSACAEVLAECKTGNYTGAELCSLAMQRLAAIAVEQPDHTTHVRDLLRERFSELGRLADLKAKGGVAVTGIPTGIRGVDAMLGGFQRGVVTVAAGRPGMGKSALALSCVRYASSHGIGCHVFSLEDTREAYTDRILSGESGVPVENMRQVQFANGDLARIRDAANTLGSGRPWLVDDRSGVTADEIVRSVRRNLSRNKTQLVVVDYIQLLGGPRGLKFDETITHNMQVLADAAKQDRISYLVLSQLNRECEKRDNKRPMLSDLKQSGSIEERAKCVLFLFREHVYDANKSAKEIEIIVAKNNQGQTGFCKANWDGPTVRVS